MGKVHLDDFFTQELLAAPDEGLCTLDPDRRPFLDLFFAFFGRAFGVGFSGDVWSIYVSSRSISGSYVGQSRGVSAILASERLTFVMLSTRMYRVGSAARAFWSLVIL